MSQLQTGNTSQPSERTRDGMPVAWGASGQMYPQEHGESIYIDTVDTVDPEDSVDIADNTCLSHVDTGRTGQPRRDVVGGERVYVSTRVYTVCSVYTGCRGLRESRSSTPRKKLTMVVLARIHSSEVVWHRGRLAARLRCEARVALNEVGTHVGSDDNPQCD